MESSVQSESQITGHAYRSSNGQSQNADRLAASRVDFPPIDAEQLASTAYLDAPDNLTQPYVLGEMGGVEIGSCLNIPLTVENRIIGLLSLFDEQVGTFDANLLQLTTMIADYAAVALENVRLRERENALWRRAEI